VFRLAVEFHIALTSAPKNPKPIEVVVDDEVGFWGVPHEASKLDKVRANWDEIDLYKVRSYTHPKVRTNRHRME
jgi:hypothetical protein